MADSAPGLERSFDHAAYSPISSGPTGAADFSRHQDPIDAAQAELASLIRLGTIKQEAGNFAEAEECFRRALEIGDRAFGPENPDLIILLNDLTRLYLKQSAYSSAEPLLLRLLELKRSKGEDHPEVATVLASLATVRQALGMHESSETLWRRVLDIRERTLAPNHFATASALEHLGDACAARGKIREALSAFERALTIREKTLGIEHPSLRVARERIADLQLQASDDTLDPMSVLDVPSAPERYRLLSGDTSTPRASLGISSAPAPQIKVTAVPKPPVSEPRPPREKKSSLSIPRTYTPPAVPIADVEPEEDISERVVFAMPSIEPSSKSDPDGAALKTATVSYRDALESVREDLEESFNEESLAARTSELFATLMAFFARRQVVAAVTVIALALLGVAIATNKHAFGESGRSSSNETTTPAPITSRVASAAANPVPVPVSNASTANAESSAARSAAKPKVTEDRTPAKKTPEKKPEQPARVAIPNLSTAALSKLDSVAARAAAVGNHAGEAISTQPTLNTVSQRRATFDDEQSNGAQRARLIGELPTPKVPAQVTDVEGEVRVRFNVDSLGRPVLETFAVVSSPNPLLTAAVRKVIPGMRFEPARTADSKAIGDVVQIGFQFARSR